MTGYFYPHAHCRHCQWPHHFRHDRPARKARRWLGIKAQPARSWVVCANCRLTTELEPGEAS